MKVYELAQEAGLTTSEVLDVCEDMGIPVTHHMHDLTHDQIDIIVSRTDLSGKLRTVFVQKGILDGGLFKRSASWLSRAWSRTKEVLRAIFWPKGFVPRAARLGLLVLLIAAWPVHVEFDRPIWTRGVDHHELYPWVYWGTMDSNIIDTEASGYVPLAASVLITER